MNFDNVERDNYVYPGQRFTSGGNRLGVGQGMSLRDWFAGQALGGIVAGYWSDPDIIGTEKEHLAQCAYEYADAMLAAREVKP